MKLFSGQAISQSGNALSVAVGLREIAQVGTSLVSLTDVATGAERLEYLLSPTKDGIFIELAGVRAGSGNVAFSPALRLFMNIKATKCRVRGNTRRAIWALS
jgi:hypothetical protein